MYTKFFDKENILIFKYDLKMSTICRSKTTDKKIVNCLLSSYFLVHKTNLMFHNEFQSYIKRDGVLVDVNN